MADSLQITFSNESDFELNFTDFVLKGPIDNGPELVQVIAWKQMAIFITGVAVTWLKF